MDTEVVKLLSGGGLSAAMLVVLYLLWRANERSNAAALDELKGQGQTLDKIAERLARIDERTRDLEVVPQRIARERTRTPIRGVPRSKPVTPMFNDKPGGDDE